MSNKIITERQIEIAHRIIDERIKDLKIIEQEASEDITKLTATQMVRYAVSRNQADYLKRQVKEDALLSENLRNFILSLLPEKKCPVREGIDPYDYGRIDAYDDWNENRTMFV